MKSFILFFSCLTLTFLCRTKSTETNEQTVSVTKATSAQTSREFTAIDSLNKYVGADSLFGYNDHPFFVGRINRQDIGIFQFSATSSVFYHKISNGWTATDTFAYPIAQITTADLNCDNYKDIVVAYSVMAAGANSENITFLYYPATKKFKHNRYYDLPNITYNKAQHKVFSAWWASAVHSQEKWAYKVTGDSLDFVQGVIYSPDEETSGQIGTVEFYIRSGNERAVTKKIIGSSDKMWAVFAKALWDTSNE